MRRNVQQFTKQSIDYKSKKQENNSTYFTRLIISILHELTEPRTDMLFLFNDCCSLFSF
jgi:hypothetical protein